jgi:hypothetical protein
MQTEIAAALIGIIPATIGGLFFFLKPNLSTMNSNKFNLLLMFIFGLIALMVMAAMALGLVYLMSTGHGGH